MKRIIACIGLFLVILVVFSHDGFADESKEEINRFAAGARLSYLQIGVSSIGDIDLDMVCDDVPTFDVNLTYYLNQYFSFELSATPITTDIEVEFDSKTGDLGELEQIAVILVGRYQRRIKYTNIFLYMGAGAGYFLNDFNGEQKDDVEEFFGSNMTAIDVDDYVSFVGSVGTEYHISKKYILNFDIKFLFAKPTFTVMYGDGTKDKTDVGLNAFTVGFGFKYCF